MRLLQHSGKPVPTDESGLAFYSVLGLTALAPAMGGSVRLWSQTILIAATGCLFLCTPARRTLGRWPNTAFILLAIVACAAFLPVNWFGVPEWRRHLVQQGAQLPQTLSAQPWLTLKTLLLFLLRLSWAYFLFTQDWNLRARRQAWVFMGLVTAGLAAAVTVSIGLHSHIPFWGDAPEFGFFPNRNHTSNVLGLGGIVIYALALHGFIEGKKSWWLWLFALSLVAGALILTYSRSGIILFCSGVFVWHLYWLISSHDRKRPLMASAAIVLLLGVFAWSGGKTATRFEQSFDIFSPTTNLRLILQRDAFELSLKSPIAGIGLGNFESVFANGRDEAIGQNAVGHPESDWLWAAVELGWIAPLLIALIFAWWVQHCFPFEAGTFRLMRMAAFICGCGFALHTAFDVPAHQLGALWPALLLASTAKHPYNRHKPSTIIAILFRIFGCVFILVAVWWFASMRGATMLPTTATVNRLETQIEQARQAEDYERLLQLSSQALTIEPLSWELYFQRGFAEAATFRPSADVRRDFAISRYLLPNWPDLYLKQIMVWLGVGEPDLAFDVLEEGMRRLPQVAPAIYADIFGAIRSDAALRDRWRQLGENDKRCLLIFLRQADSTEFQIELQTMLSKDPELRSFTADELKTLFSFWYEKGDELRLAQTLRENPEWKKIGWRQLARSYADYQDYRQAYETAAEFVPYQTPAPSDSNRARSQVRNDPTDAKAAIALALEQADEGKVDNALSIVMVIGRLPDAPKDLPAIEARLWATKRNWKRAWTTIAPLVIAH
jgi:tetratricopeptide (TPR) repeat protein